MYFVFVSAGWKSIFKVDISGWFVIPNQISFPVKPETLTPPFVCLCPGSSLTDCSVNSTSEADTLGLSFTSNVCFSVWVSFCEIYNDNIHDLLDQVTHSRSQLVTYAAWAKRSILSICNIFSNMNWIVLQLIVAFRFPVDTINAQCCVCHRTSRETPLLKVRLPL